MVILFITNLSIYIMYLFLSGIVTGHQYPQEPISHQLLTSFQLLV